MYFLKIYTKVWGKAVQMQKKRKIQNKIFSFKHEMLVMYKQHRKKDNTRQMLPQWLAQK